MSAQYYSMTGYAHIQTKSGNQQIKIHLKSVNHRFCEVKVRVPRSWATFEPTLKRIIQQKIQRGSLELWVESLSEGQQGQNQVADFFSKLTLALQQSQKGSSLSLPSPLRALILSRFPDLWLGSKDEESLSEEALTNSLHALCEKLLAEKAKEGAAIVVELLNHCHQLEISLNKLKNEVPLLRSEWEKRLKSKLEEFAKELKTSPLPEERLLQEFLLLAEKRDVAEEIQRIEMHLKGLRELLEKPKADGLGKRLEFSLQELHREWTTFGNKIQNVAVSTEIVEAKILLERLREQALNLA